MMILEWPLTILQQGQICVPIHLYRKTVEKKSQLMAEIYKV